VVLSGGLGQHRDDACTRVVFVGHHDSFGEISLNERCGNGAVVEG
jgi:hypothetical protein